MSQKIWSCSLSAILLMICIVFGAVKGKDCLGMDFTGGSSISYLVNKGDISFREVEGVVNKLSLTQKGYGAGGGGVHGQQQSEYSD